MKICRECGIEKSLEEFPRDKRWRNSYKADCKLCFNIKRRAKYNPEEEKKSKLRHIYGIDWDSFMGLYTKQNGCCAICSTTLDIVSGDSKVGKAHVDHCHTTGAVRGLLCTKCNTLLGMADDNITVLSKAITYLDRGQDD